MTSSARQRLRLVRPVDADEFVFSVADGTRLDVEADGPVDAPVSLVFVHGFTLNLTSYRHQRAALEAAGGEVRRFFYDQRGFGTSERGPRGRASIRQLADDLAELVEAAPGRVVLVGHSMGGMVIQELAGHRPDLIGSKVRGAVLIATAGSGSEINLHGLEPLVKLAGARMLRGLHGVRPLVRLAGRIPYSLAAWLFHDVRSPRVHRRAFADMVAPNRLDVMADYLEAMLAYDARGTLAELSRISTIVVAGGSDLITTVAANRRVARAIDGAELVVVPRAGHMVPFENAAAVDGAIADIVERVLTQR